MASRRLIEARYSSCPALRKREGFTWDADVPDTGADDTEAGASSAPARAAEAKALAAWIAGMELSPIALIAALTVFYIIIGMFLDGISAVVLTMAIIEPMIRAAGIDLIWFGIFIVVVVEMAQITPPIGFNLFVLQGMTSHEMNFIARAAIPMFLIMVVMVFVLIAIPELATWLPENIRQRN